MGDPGSDEPFIDIAAKQSGETPSSCMIIDMLDGRVAKTDNAPLIRFRLEGTKPSVLSIGVSGELNGRSREEYADECARVRRSELVRECVRLRCHEEAGLPERLGYKAFGGRGGPCEQRICCIRSCTSASEHLRVAVRFPRIASSSRAR